MDIRIIYSYDTEKSIIEYNILKNIIKKHELFVYNGLNEPKYEKLKKVKYNIYIDVIPEDAYLNLPCINTILIVNDLYISEDIYLRREYYKKIPFIKIHDVVNYYICITHYSYKILSKVIDKKKLIYFNIVDYASIINANSILKNLLLDKHKEKNHILINMQKNFNKKYILYEIDIYSNIKNIIMLKVWEKYFINSDKILIIKFLYRKENIIKYFTEISKIKVKINFITTYIFKNIILTNDSIDIYNKDIGCYIINRSYYSLAINLYKAILNNKFIITSKNTISKELLKENVIYFNKFTELELKNCLDQYLNNIKI